MKLRERVKLDNERFEREGAKEITIPIGSSSAMNMKNVVEYTERGKTKFLYIIKQLTPEYGVPGTEDNPVVCNLFKIGYASKPKARLSQVRSGNPYQLELIFEYETPQPKILEWLVQCFFDSHHHRGEWFLIPDDMMESFITEKIFNMFIEGSPALGYTEEYGGGRILYDHRMFLEETKK